MNTPDSSSGIESGTQLSEPSPPHSLSHPTPISPSTDSTDLEHAYWAEYEEDTTTPDEDEMKEIDGGDSDYSACDRRFEPFARSPKIRDQLTVW